MNPERWREVKAIFHAAVECDPATRAQFVRESCGSDGELRREVESLLESAEDPASLLENPVIDARAIALAAPAPGSMLGRTIGNYVITGELARGGMGVVYRARHVSLPRDVVVKCIRRLALSEEARIEQRARFRREAHIQSQLNHPNIVQVYEFFDLDEEYYLVMEFVPGFSVRSLLDKSGRLPSEQVSTLAVEALNGLEHAHGLRYVDESGKSGVGITHRDIKPGNLLVDDKGNLKLADFGIAKIGGEGQLTKTGFNPGTVEYMSPEQIRGLPVDARSDLYSLGVTLYEMLTGHVPFPSSDSDYEYDLLKAHVETDPPPVRRFNPEIPRRLAYVVTRSLNRDPEDRWQTAADFRKALSSRRPFVLQPQLLQRRRVRAAGLILLLAAVLAGAFWLARGARMGGRAQVAPSIAVLPFVDLSHEQNLAYFGDGMAEEVMTDLAHVPGLRVIGKTSAFRLRGQSGDPRAIAKKLNVTTVLEGSVRQQGRETRIAVQLIDGSNGTNLWSQTYKREMNDIFAVQEEIARAVTGALRVTLLGAKGGPAKSTNAEAYNLYLRGRYLLTSNSQTSLEKAAGYLQQAVDLDPGYAPAWADLADCRRVQAGSGYIPTNDGYKSAEEAVEKALALDRNLGAAYTIQGEIKDFHDWDWAEADASYKRALALLPGDADVMRSAGSLARHLGRLDEAIRLYRSAIEIDPLFGHKNQGMNLYYAGRHEEAKAALQKALELSPGSGYAHAFLAWIYLAQSRPADALAEAEKEPNHVYRVFALALTYHALGRTTESEAKLSELKSLPDTYYQVAETYAFRGETDLAFQWLDRAYTERDPGITDMKTDPLLQNLRSDPRYVALLKRMNLPI